MRIVMMGTGTFAEPTFEALLANFGADVVGLVTQPPRDGGHKRGSTRQIGKGMAAIASLAGRASDGLSVGSNENHPSLARPANNVAIAQPESINSPEGIEQLRAMKPDLLVVAAYGQILSKDVLAIPTRGVINVHASLLPKYRGAAPVAYAILNGEKQTGVTIIKVTPGLDSGDMILQEALDILPDDTTGSLEARLAVLGAKLAVDAVKMYQSGEPVPGRKQDPALVTKAPKIKKEFGLIDWSKPAEEICRHIRAMQPWPTAYTFLHRPGKEPMRVIVNAVAKPLRRLVTSEDDGVPSGEVAGWGGPDGEAYVCAAVVEDEATTVQLLELQPAGKKRMTVEEFSRGYPWVEGMRFGPEQASGGREPPDSPAIATKSHQGADAPRSP